MSGNIVLEAIMVLVPMILSLTVHEFAHAASAKALGDDTAERMGRLTLNPMAHIDPIGTIGLPLLLWISGSGIFFGWAKPVPVSPNLFNRKVTMRTGMMVTAAAGPWSNLVLAFIAQGVLALAYHTGALEPGPVLSFVLRMLQINVVLAVFNMIPIHPLDGQKVLLGFLPPAQAIRFERFSTQYGWMMLVAVMLLGGRILGPPMQVIFGGLAALFGMPT